MASEMGFVGFRRSKLREKEKKVGRAGGRRGCRFFLCVCACARKALCEREKKGLSRAVVLTGRAFLSLNLVAVCRVRTYILYVLRSTRGGYEGRVFSKYGVSGTETYSQYRNLFSRYSVVRTGRFLLPWHLLNPHD